MSNKSSRVQSNLLQQNCYVRDCSPAVDVRTVLQDEPSYVSLDEVSDDNGVHFEYNSYPYPVTPQYVNSFVESSDYRRDPVSAVVNGVKHNNLGDIRDFQNIVNMDSSVQRELYEQLKSKFEVKSAVNSEVNSEVNSVSEVK